MNLPSRRNFLLTPLLCWRPVRSPATSPLSPARNLRLATAQGTVRLYWPKGFAPATAGVVVYVHGLYTDVDGAWTEHHLAAQFAASGRNALFIVVPSRTKASDQPRYHDLAELLDLVTKDGGAALPAGPVVLAAHSGGYKQVAVWLADPRPTRVLFLDALYGNETELRAWLDRRPDNRMALVSHETRRAAAAWTRSIPFAVKRATCPATLSGLSRRERDAKLLSLRTDEGHFAIITAGRDLPLLLRWSGLPGV